MINKYIPIFFVLILASLTFASVIEDSLIIRKNVPHKMDFGMQKYVYIHLTSKYPFTSQMMKDNKIIDQCEETFMCVLYHGHTHRVQNYTLIIEYVDPTIDEIKINYYLEFESNNTIFDFFHTLIFDISIPLIVLLISIATIIILFRIIASLSDKRKYA